MAISRHRKLYEIYVRDMTPFRHVSSGSNVLGNMFWRVKRVPRHRGRYVAIVCWPKNLHSDIAPDGKGFTTGRLRHREIFTVDSQFWWAKKFKGGKAPCRHQKTHEFSNSEIARSRSEIVSTVSPSVDGKVQGNGKDQGKEL